MIPSRPIIAATVLALGAAALWPVHAQPRRTRQVVVPARGTPLRQALLDAVRQHVGTKSQFKVAHLAVWDSVAFVRAGEVVPDDEGLQETDLFVEALLERRSGRWTVRESWNLSTEPDGASHDAFLRRVRARRAALGLPAALFPADLRESLRR